MDLDQLSAMSEADLKKTANEKLQTLEQHGTGDHPSILGEAQFYIDEIERRAAEDERKRQGEISTRDFRMEFAVIVLIGLELIVAVVAIVLAVLGSREEMTVLNGLKTNAGQQLQLPGSDLAALLKPGGVL